MRTIETWVFPCASAMELRLSLESHAEYGPGAPRHTLVYVGDRAVVGMDLVEETLPDGSKVHRIELKLQEAAL